MATILPSSVCCFAALESATVTTCTNKNSFYYILGSFTNEPIYGFTPVNSGTPGIRYDGENGQYFKVDYFAAVSDGNNSTAYIGIAINGVTNYSSINGTQLKTTGAWYNIAGTCLFLLNKNDIVSLMTASDQDNTELTYQHFNTSITTI